MLDANGADITDVNHIGVLNPFRYRGYFYDSETGLYYLKTHYYDPDLAPWRVLGIDECGEALPQKTARYARTFLGTPFSRRRSQAHATQRITRTTREN